MMPVRSGPHSRATTAANGSSHLAKTRSSGSVLTRTDWRAFRGTYRAQLHLRGWVRTRKSFALPGFRGVTLACWVVGHAEPDLMGCNTPAAFEGRKRRPMQTLEGDF